MQKGSAEVVFKENMGKGLYQIFPVPPWQLVSSSEELLASVSRISVALNAGPKPILGAFPCLLEFSPPLYHHDDSGSFHA